jgi:hypothetical protein
VEPHLAIALLSSIRTNCGKFRNIAAAVERRVVTSDYPCLINRSDLVECRHALVRQVRSVLGDWQKDLEAARRISLV